MADLTRVLFEHHACMEDGGGFDGCVCGKFEPWDIPLGEGGFEAHAAHVAQMLADAGLVASETEWGVLDPDHPEASVIVCNAEAEARAIAGPVPHDPSVWDVVRREVAPWITAQPAQIDALQGQGRDNGAGADA